MTGPGTGEGLRRLAGAALAVVLLTAAAAVGGAALSAGPAHAQTLYRYWVFFHGTGGGWTASGRGAATWYPKDGAVEGWRYQVAGDGSGRPPRTSVPFGTVCAGVPATAGRKRVAFVFDYGTRADARPGQTPPRLRAGCATGRAGASAQEMQSSIASVRLRSDGLLCAFDGYPSTGCVDTIATAPSPPSPPPPPSVTAPPSATAPPSVTAPPNRPAPTRQPTAAPTRRLTPEPSRPAPTRPAPTRPAPSRTDPLPASRAVPAPHRPTAAPHGTATPPSASSPSASTPAPARRRSTGPTPARPDPATAPGSATAPGPAGATQGASATPALGATPTVTPPATPTSAPAGLPAGLATGPSPGAVGGPAADETAAGAPLLTGTRRPDTTSRSAVPALVGLGLLGCLGVATAVLTTRRRHDRPDRT